MSGRSAGVERFLEALSGRPVAPAVTGITFIGRRILAGAEPDTDPARRLAAVCSAESLDFAFVEAQVSWGHDAAAALTGAGVASVWAVPGVVWAAFGVIGVMEGIKAVASGGGQLVPLLDEACEAALAAARRGFGAGATALVVAEDLAGSAGPLLEPDFVRRAVLPRLARVVDEARAAGIPSILHCDGDARFLMADAARAGFVAIHGDAGGAAGLAEGVSAARAAGLAFLGGVPTGGLGANAGTNSVAADEQATRLRELARAGGLLVSDDGGLTTVEEAESLLAVLRAVREARS